MSRYWLRILVISLILGTLKTAVAQFPRNPPPNRPGTPGASTGKFLMIPGMMPLSMETVLRDLGVTPEQRQQLKAVSDGFAASIRQLNKSMEDLSPEDQEKRAPSPLELRGANDRAAKLARAAQHKAEAILSLRQLKVVRQMAFELSGAGALVDPGLQEKLGLSPEQRRRLNSVYEKAGEKMQQLQRETAKQAMELLDDDQAEALKKQLDSQQKPR